MEKEAITSTQYKKKALKYKGKNFCSSEEKGNFLAEHKGK
jgi:hypothetical protein